MRKIIYAGMFCLAVSFNPFFSYGQETREGMAGKGMMKKGAMGGYSMMDKGKMGKQGMCGMMMHSMMTGQSLVATSDGGVVVLAGNKILKYDKDLNLKKEAEIKIDMAQMQKMMKQMMESCPMSEDMKDETSTKGQNATTSQQ